MASLDDLFSAIFSGETESFIIDRILFYDPGTRLGKLRNQLDFRGTFGTTLESGDEVLVLIKGDHRIAIAVLDRPFNAIVLDPIEGLEPLPPELEPGYIP